MFDGTQLRETVTLIEQQMLLKLQEIRKTYKHKGIKGSVVENEFRTFLAKYLPRRLSIGTGEIIDRKFNRSNQMDVVIATEDHPFTFTENDPGLFFVEGVSGCGEIKSVLTKDLLINSLEKASNYKNLTIIPPRGAVMHTNKSDGDRFFRTPPFFIFAFESKISLENILEVVSNYRIGEYRPGYTADGIFILNKGFVVDFGDGKGDFRIKVENNTHFTKWQGVQSDTVLFDFLIWLNQVMQRMVGGSNILTPYLLS